MSTNIFSVTGLTCAHCVAAVTDELSAIPGVRDVRIELVPGGTSQVSVDSDLALDDDTVGAALDEAGDYRLTAS